MLAVATLSLLCSTAAKAEPVSESPGSIEVPEPASPAPIGAIIPWGSRSSVNLDAVWWTAPQSESVAQLAARWGADDAELAALNPSLADGRVDEGERLVVYRHDPDTVSQSVGAPNRGHIEHAAPFPDGNAWVLRTFRPRSYATRHTVDTLATALTDWHERHPTANPVKLGEFSKRGGGRVRPHASHRTGRDVDIGYVMAEPDLGHRFVRADAQTIDAAATWGLVHRLLASGDVQSIFMDSEVQALLLPFAAQSLTLEEQRSVFSLLAFDARSEKKAIIRAWRGHDDHMHIRLRCTPTDAQCRETAAKRKRRKRRKSKRRRSKRRR